jgi:DNA-binding LacI/PurR family transcriptional regulator
MPSRPPATYKDIQRLTGLSLATISKHYNGLNVRPENRAAIEKAAAELGYRVNSFARGLREGASRTIGVILPSLQNGFHLSVVVEAERRLRDEGIGVLVTSDGVDGAQDAVELLLNRQVDGIIAVPGPKDLTALRSAQTLGVPLVTVDWSLPDLGADTVLLDNAAAGRQAARYLIDHGHRDVAVVAGPDWVSTLRERRDGFLSEMSHVGKPVLTDRVLSAAMTADGGYGAMWRALNLDRRPGAIFTTNHELTVGALIALGESGLRLGRDISLIGFDAVEVAQTTRPRLTVIAQPVSEIARAAAEAMLDRLNGSDAPPKEASFLGHLIVGGSVADHRDG